MRSKNRISRIRISQFLAIGLLLAWPTSVWSQAVTATVSVGSGPVAVAVNKMTNKIYVANIGDRTVVVIDGTTNSTTTVQAALRPVAVAVNEATNKIYVANQGFGGPFGNGDRGSVTVIDEATNLTTTVIDPNANGPHAVAVNSVTNKIYVANFWTGNVTVIDGATNSTVTVADSNANGLAAYALAVNPSTNKIYVANNNLASFSTTSPGNVTVIDGATNSLSFVSAGPNSHILHAVALDSVTNTTYVTSEGCFQEDPCRNPGSVAVINGSTNAVTTIINPSAHNPEGVAVNEMNNKIYVANTGSNNVSVIDGGAIPTSHTLSVVLEGSGSGTVTSNPTGINCGTSCVAYFTPGTTVSLAASPASGSQFSGWSTNCSGTASCNVTLTTSDEFVTATFNTAPPPDFSITPASASLTLQRGAQVSDVITIAPLNGSFSNDVQLSCAVIGSTPLATCSLTATSVTPGANPVTSTLTITAPTQSAQLTPSSEGQRSSPLYAVFLPIPLALIGLGLTSAKSKQRRHRLWLLCSLFNSIVALQAGCGGGSSNQLRPPPLNYTVTVTATSGAIRHTAQVTVTVE